MPRTVITAATRRVRVSAAPSQHEALLLLHLRTLTDLPEPEREARFHPTRRWRFDLCWRAERIAVEAEGAHWASGRHTRGSGFAADIEKYNAAALLGWLVIRCTGQQIESGQALAWVEAAFAARRQGASA